MLKDMLTLTGVKVGRKTITNTDGEVSESVSYTDLPRAALWSPGQSQRYMSDRMAKVSTHVLVTLPSDYTFTVDDCYVTYNGVTYKIVSPSDDVMNLGEMMLTGLERIQ